MRNGTLQFLAYIVAIGWALVVSPRRWKLLFWMISSWLIGWVVVGSMVLWHFRNNSNAGVILADYWTIPSFIVPAVTGIVQVRQQKRRLKA